MLQVLEGTEASLCQIDDILVFGKLFKEHDKHLKETLYKLQEVTSYKRLTLNEEKCEFAKSSVEFLDTIVNSEGIQVDPKKVEFTIIIIYNEDGKL